ncbi:MAG: alginate O-acetyltransferase AlgX-related protein [bacterium]
MKLSKSKIIAVVFSVFIALPVIAQISHPQPDILKTENRKAASFPALPNTLAQWQHWPDDVDLWINDRFGLRQSFIALNGKLSSLLEMKAGSDSRVVIGKDGWLFYGKRKVVETYMGTAGYTDEKEPEQWVDGVLALKQEVEATGAEFVVMLIPNKPTIYPEMMPDTIPVMDTPRRFDVLIDHAKMRGLKIITPRERLLAAKAEGQLYNKTDTHWSSRGAYEGYYTVIQELRRRRMKMRLLQLSQLRSIEKEFATGDLATMINSGEKLSELSVQWYPKRRTKATTELLDKYKFRAFKTRIVTTEAKDKPTLLILGDSFSFTMLRYFQESFSRIVFVHHQAGAFDRAVLEEYKSDVVLLSMVERFLIDPWGSPNSDMPGANKTE